MKPLLSQNEVLLFICLSGAVDLLFMKNEQPSLK